MKSSIIIPAFNEEESIGFVLDRIPSNDIFEILVIDGGSKDHTVAIAKARGAQVIHEQRRGYGRACATGVEHAASEIVVFLDADGADDPSQIPELVAPLINGDADMVLGSRLGGIIHSGAMPPHQYFGNWLSASLIRLLYGYPITDLSPFRAVDRSKLMQLEMQEMTYGWPTEMIAKAARKKWRISEIPANYFPRHGGKSKISGTLRGTIFATYYILSTIFKYVR
jgi:glycosyltransferase involved in cell wall biosynthesis